MSLIPMIGGLLEKRPFYCEHHKIPQIVPDTTKYNPAIRLQEISRLRKLGDRDYHRCKDCNQYVCSCMFIRQLDTSSDRERKSNKSLSLPDHTMSKGVSIRSQIFDKIRDSYSRCKNKPTSLSDNKLLKEKSKSLIWLLRPTKRMHCSETNVLVTKPKVKSSKYQQSEAEPTITNPCNSHTEKVKASEIAIPKGTKEYFNERKRKFGGQLKKPLLETGTLEQNLCKDKKEQKTNCIPTKNAPTEVRKQKFCFKKLLTNRKNEMFLDVPIKKAPNGSTEYCNDNLIKPSAKPTNNLSEPKLSTPTPSKGDCIEHRLHTRSNNQIKERKKRPLSNSEKDSPNLFIASSDSAQTCIYCSEKEVVKDYNCSMQSEEPKNRKKIRHEKSVQTSTANSTHDLRSTSSMNVNFTESCSRMSDFKNVPEKKAAAASNKGKSAKGNATKLKHKNSGKTESSDVKKTNELKDAYKSRITERTEVAKSSKTQPSDSCTAEMAEISEAASSKLLPSELSRAKNSKILHKKHLTKHKKFLIQRFGKQESEISTQSTTGERHDLKQSAHGVTKISTKKKISSDERSTHNLQTDIKNNSINMMKRNQQHNTPPTQSAKNNLHNPYAAENQPSLVTVTNRTCTYSFHRPITYNELCGAYDVYNDD